MILVAFAIQFGSVGAGISAAAAATPECLQLREGGFLALWWSGDQFDGRSDALLRGPRPEEIAAPGAFLGWSGPAPEPVAEARRVLSVVELPIPPPAGV